MSIKVRRRALRNAAHALLESLEPRQLFSGYSVDRVSLNDNGLPSTEASGTSSISADGNLVVFTSTAALTPGVTANGQDLVYLRNRTTNHTILISKANDGAQPDAKAAEPQISADGNFIVYSSPATNLGSTPNLSGFADIYLYDVAHDTTTLISTGLAGAAADSSSSTPTISTPTPVVAPAVPDHRYIAFLSNAANLIADDTNNASDIFVYDIDAASITRVSTAGGNQQANGANYSPAISANGHYVAFVSDATNLIAGDTNGFADVFLKDITTAGPNSGSLQRLSVASGVSGAQSNGKSGRIAISADGRYVAFESSATTLVPGDTNNFANDDNTDIFLHDSTLNTTIRVSVGSSPTATQSNGISTKPSISADGRYVTYTSTATNLVPADTNASTDIFLFDRAILSTRRISTGPNDAQTGSPSTPGPNTADSDDSTISSDGRFIVFRSNAENLLTVGQDQNGVGDIFIKDRLAAPHATVFGPDTTTAIAAGDTTPISSDGTDFGILDVADSPVTRTFTITNTGSDRLSLFATPIIRIAGANASDFTVTLQPANGSSPIDPGASVTFIVSFKPTAPGLRTATITFTSDDANSPYTFAISGIGIDQTIASRMLVTQSASTLTTTAGTTAPAGGTPFNFGNYPLHSANPLNLTFTILNVSAQPITLDHVSIPLSSGFILSSDISALIISPGETATFTIGMLPDVRGAATATVQIGNQGASDHVYATFDVAGTITIPIVAVLIGSTPLTPAQTVAFGPVVQGSSAVSKTFTIRNDGLAPLTLTLPTLPAGYTLTTQPALTIAAGATTTFTVQLDSSTALGAKNGNLSFTTNDPDHPTYTLALTGSVTTPGFALAVDGSPVVSNSTVTNFGSAVQNATPPTKTFTITNTGTAPLNVALGAPSTGFAIVSSPTATIAPGATATFVLSLTTTAVAASTGSLTITTNDANNATFTVKLAGTVISNSPTAVLLLDGTVVTAVSFGTLAQSRTPVTRTLTLRNDGSVPLTIGTLALPVGFSLTAAPASSVLSGQSTSFTLSFTPLLAGLQSGALAIPVNDTSRPTIHVGLTATVTPATKTALTVESVTTKLPSLILGGTKTTYAASVSLANNSKSTITGPYKITLYASHSPIATPGIDKVLGTTSASLKLAPKAKSTQSVKLKFSNPPADGAYYIVAVVTGAHADPVFNTAKAPFTVRLEKSQAKLGRATTASPALTAKAGAKVSPITYLLNSGNTAIAGSLKADIYITKTGSLTGATKVGTAAALKFTAKPKSSAKLIPSFTLPKTTPAGAYTVILKITKVSSATPNLLLNDGLVGAGKITVK